VISSVQFRMTEIQWRGPSFLGHGCNGFVAAISDDSVVPFAQSWTTATLHLGVPQVSSASHFHTFTKLSSAVSPDVPDISGNSYDKIV